MGTGSRVWGCWLSAISSWQFSKVQSYLLLAVGYWQLEILQRVEGG